MANLLKILFLLTFLFGCSCAQNTPTKKPHVVIRYGGLGGGGGGGPAVPIPEYKKAPPPPLPLSDAKPLPPGAEFLGSWKIDKENAGVSAMHMQLMPNNKVVWFDSTQNGRSEIDYPDRRFCKQFEGFPEQNNKSPLDCTAHAVEYDPETADVRTLRIQFNPWCSSGGLSPKGVLVSTGGVRNGIKAVRLLKACPGCDFEEKELGLLGSRWYSTQHMLENGSFVVMGGASAYNYEIIAPDTLQFRPKMIALPWLGETKEFAGENNLYPFVNLLPDGNIFVFAKDSAIKLEPYTGKILYRYPKLTGGIRNYPPSGMSTLLPIDIDEHKGDPHGIEVNVLVCGGNHYGSYNLSDRKESVGMTNRVFVPALKDCGRLNLMKIGAQWDKDEMPSPRVMGDMLLLPTGDVLMLNGAKAGTSAWNAAADPNHYPVLYSYYKPKGQRFKVLTPTPIPRMYHSSCAVLSDGSVLVAGSNTNGKYMHGPEPGMEYAYPTDLRVEKFYPPYLDPRIQGRRANIIEDRSDTEWTYGGEYTIKIRRPIDDEFDENAVKVTMYSPPFTTHGYSMNQRLLILKKVSVLPPDPDVGCGSRNGFVRFLAPPSGRLAPPGFYLVFVVHRGVPSRGLWVHIDK